MAGPLGLGYRIGAGGGGSGGVPLAIATSLPTTGLKLQLEADTNAFQASTNCPNLYSDAGVTHCTSGAAVQQMNDSSGNGKNFTNASVSGLTCVIQSNTNGAVAPNGRSYIAAAGGVSVNNWIQGALAADANFLHQGPCTVFMLINPTASTNGVLLDTGSVNSSGPGVYLFHEGSGKTGSLQLLSRGTGSTNGTANMSIVPRGVNANAVPSGVWGVIAYDYDAGNPGKATLYYNRGMINAQQVNCGAPSTNSCRGPARILDHQGATIPYAGGFGGMWAYDHVLSASDFSQVHQYITGRYGTPHTNVACMGDSITAGLQTGGDVNSGTYPGRLQSRLGCGYNVFNFGHSGDKVADTKAIFEATSATVSVPSCAGVWRNGFKMVCIGVGVNDLGNGTSGTTVFNSLKALYDEAIADPQTLVVIRTIGPFKGNTSFWSATTAADYDLVNNSIRNYCTANPANTRCMDMQLVFAGGTDRYSMPTGLTPDGLHPNQQGTDLDAANMQTVIQSFGLAV
jgi:lysophospholipase L1-like esterase